MCEDNCFLCLVFNLEEFSVAQRVQLTADE